MPVVSSQTLEADRRRKCRRTQSIDRRPIRVVRIIARLNVGGPAIHTLLLTEGLHRPGYDSVLVTGCVEPLEGDLSGRARERGLRLVVVPSLRRPLNAWRDLQAWWRIFRILCREQPDVVHTHTAKAGALGRTAAMVYNGLRPRSRCRLVHTFHGHVLEGYFGPAATRAFLAIERFLARRTDRILTVSSAVREDLLGRRIGTPEQLCVVPLGLSLEPLLELPPPEARRVPLRVGIVGRLVPIKNHELLLRAAKACRDQPGLTPLHFYVVGDGERRGPLERMADAMGLNDSITFTGWQADMAGVYRDLDIVCLTSLNEGTPVSLIEALAAARPVAATDVGGVRDLLGPGQADAGAFRKAAHGVLVRSGDAQGIAEALRYLAAHPEERRTMGHAGRAFVRDRYAQSRLISDIEALYRELMA